MSLFSQCVKGELVILIKGLEALDDSRLIDELKEHKNMCLGTLYSELENRYTKREKK